MFYSQLHPYRLAFFTKIDAWMSVISVLFLDLILGFYFLFFKKRDSISNFVGLF